MPVMIGQGQLVAFTLFILFIIQNIKIQSRAFVVVKVVFVAVAAVEVAVTVVDNIEVAVAADELQE